MLRASQSGSDIPSATEAVAVFSPIRVHDSAGKGGRRRSNALGPECRLSAAVRTRFLPRDLSGRDLPPPRAAPPPLKRGRLPGTLCCSPRENGDVYPGHFVVRHAKTGTFTRDTLLFAMSRSVRRHCMRINPGTFTRDTLLFATRRLRAKTRAYVTQRSQPHGPAGIRRSDHAKANFLTPV
jgi:hypothetical protein